MAVNQNIVDVDSEDEHEAEEEIEVRVTSIIEGCHELKGLCLKYPRAFAKWSSQDSASHFIFSAFVVDGLGNCSVRTKSDELRQENSRTSFRKKPGRSDLRHQ